MGEPTHALGIEGRVVQLFDNEHCHRYPQGRCVVIAPTKWDYLTWDNYPFWGNGALLWSSKADAVFYINKPVRLSDLLLDTGMVESRSEFKRRVKERAVIYESPVGDLKPIKCDFTFTVYRERSFGIRLGVRVLETAGTGTRKYRQRIDERKFALFRDLVRAFHYLVKLPYLHID